MIQEHTVAQFGIKKRVGVNTGAIIKVSLKARQMFQASRDMESFVEGQIYKLHVRCIKRS